MHPRRRSRAEFGLVKDGCEFVKSPISFIINKSINSGIVPEDVKFARVKIIFKKNSPLDFSNYMPVSILSIVSKNHERSISTQLNDFIKK